MLRECITICRGRPFLTPKGSPVSSRRFQPTDKQPTPITTLKGSHHSARRYAFCSGRDYVA